MNFHDFKLDSNIQKALDELGFTVPTEIQQKTIPKILDGHDVIAGSKTGSGKTLAFGIPATDFCNPGMGIQTLILTPTRELTDQIMDVLRSITKYKKLKITSIYGGVAYEPQYDALKTADIVVATPGRLLDHCNQNSIDLSSVNLLVLDEADRMLEMGFVEDVDIIVSHCPVNRQTLLFSATIRGVVDQMTGTYLHEPVEVSAGERVDASKLSQAYYDIAERLKTSLLIHLIKQDRVGLVMIFCNSRHAVDIVADALNANGIKALGIHGGFSQNKRTNTLTSFNDQKIDALVCTDVAARGLDVQGVSHVYNFDIPMDSKQYIHRIGRTARAGSDGKAINLVSPRDYDYFDRVLRDNNLDIPKLDKPYVKEIRVNFSKNDSRGRSRNGGNRRPGQNRSPRPRNNNSSAPRRNQSPRK